MRLRLAFLVLPLALAGCAAAPITIPLQDFQFTNPQAISNTSQVVFVGQQLETRPPVPLASVSLDGNVTYQAGDFALSFYASANRPSCPPLSGQPGVYVCDSNLGLPSIGRVDFLAGATQPLRLSGSQLTSGINNGRLWLGVRLERGTAPAGTVRLHNMVARAAVF
jgi:hypothetical protein